MNKLATAFICCFIGETIALLCGWVESFKVFYIGLFLGFFTILTGYGLIYIIKNYK